MLARASLLLVVFFSTACDRPDEPPPREPCRYDGVAFTVQGIEAQGSHTCALLSPCGALCWGANDLGQSGFEPATVLAVPLPTWVARSFAFVDLSLAEHHTCGLANDATVWCWGSLEDLPEYVRTSEPYLIDSVPSRAVELAATGFGTCAILEDSSVACWGTWGIDAFDAPERVAGVERAVHVANGGTHACAILDDGSIRCWGQNTFGQLGDGTTGFDTSRDDARPVVGLPEPTVRLALAQEVSCAILSSGRIYCWGEGQDGILGNGSLNGHATPTEVVDLDAIADADVEDHACAARNDGSLACWGADVFLETGGTSDEHLTPVSVPGITNVVDVAVGFWYTCVLMRDQEIYCWGANSNHELGLGDSSPLWVHTPTRVDWRAALPPAD